MFKRLLVPDSVLVEHEKFLSLRIFEDHIWIEHVCVPKQRRFTLVGVNLDQVFDVDINSYGQAESIDFTEVNLFCVGVQLCMVRKVDWLGNFARHWHTKHSERHKQKGWAPSDPAKTSARDEEVDEAGLQVILRLRRLIQENSIFMGFHARKAREVTNFLLSKEKTGPKLPYESVLKP